MTGRLLLLFFSFFATADLCRAQDKLIVCGGSEVFIVPAKGKELAEKDRLWRWRPADSPQIPKEMHRQFRSTDECKPVGDAILITSSSGGVALIRRKDKKCLFYSSARNAHSACLLPEGRVAVASSHGGDHVLLYSLQKPGEKVSPLTRHKLDGAHGVHWDGKRRRLWALGTHFVLLLEVKEKSDHIVLALDKQWKLPTQGGHDLFPIPGTDAFFVTTNTKVYRFDCGSGKFAPLPGLGDLPKVKSVDQHPKTGRIVFHQGTAKTWWSDTIRIFNPKHAIRLPNERLYKVRWDVPRQMPQ